MRARVFTRQCIRESSSVVRDHANGVDCERVRHLEDFPPHSVISPVSDHSLARLGFLRPLTSVRIPVRSTPTNLLLREIRHGPGRLHAWRGGRQRVGEKRRQRQRGSPLLELCGPSNSVARSVKVGSARRPMNHKHDF